MTHAVGACNKLQAQDAISDTSKSAESANEKEFLTQHVESAKLTINTGFCNIPSIEAARVSDDKKAEESRNRGCLLDLAVSLESREGDM